MLVHHLELLLQQLILTHGCYDEPPQTFNFKQYRLAFFFFSSLTVLEIRSLTSEHWSHWANTKVAAGLCSFLETRGAASCLFQLPEAALFLGWGGSPSALNFMPCRSIPSFTQERSLD